MSDPTAVPNDLNEVVRDYLAAHRPAGVPAALPYRAAQDTAAVERPFMVSLCEGVRVENHLLVMGTLVLRMKTRADEQAAADAATWHRLSVALIRGNLEDLTAAMQAKGWWLVRLTPGEYDDAPDGRRGRMYEQRWDFEVQTGLP